MSLKRKNSDGTWSTIGGKGAGDYSALGDVDTTGLTDGCTTRYDSGTAKWKPVKYIDDTGAATTTNVWSAAKVKSITDALTSVASIKVVTELPVPPVNNTMYYVGTASPYHIYLRANNITYDMGTTSISLDGYEKTSNRVTTWQSTPDDAHYPTEKLVKDSINAKASAIALSSHTGNTGNPHDVTKAQVGLGNCDNTSDLSKPISTATQTALDGKQPQHTTGTNTLTVSGWNSTTKQQQISITGVTATNTVIVSPSGANYLEYNTAQIRCISQVAGALTFQCETVPTSDIVVDVVILS